MVDQKILQNIVNLRNDPVRFIYHLLGCELWHKQKIIAKAVVKYPKVAVRSCHASGKTHLSARIALWWLLTRPNSIVITTAPTARQVNELLWKEIRLAYKNAPIPLGGTLYPKASKLFINDGWLCIGFTADDDVSFQGWHAPGGILAILDEAAGVPPPIWHAIDGVLTGENDRMLAIANPTEPSGPFFELCKRVKGFQISAFDVPNVKEGREVIPGLCSKQWVDARREEWGESSPMWQSRVLGEFPDADDRSLVPLSWIDAAFARYHETQWSKITTIGADIARKGADSTVFALANDQGVREIKREPKQTIPETAGALLHTLRESGAKAAHIDADGLGSGVFDLMAESEPDAAKEMRGGMRADDPARYFNRRSEWYWGLRERLDPDGPAPIALPRNETLQHQLTSIRWALTTKGQIKIESKQDMIKRGIKSPDEADAVAYAMASTGDGFVFV